MPGSGVWLDDETYLKTAGQMWAQQQTQTLQAGHDWANQQIQQTLSQLQQMVPQVSTQPAPAPVPPPPVMPPPEAPPPVPVQPPPPQVPIGGTQVAPPIPTPTPPLPTPTPQPAPSLVSPSTTSTTPAADAGETWAQQQIQSLLNPSTAPQPSSTAPTTDALAPTQPPVPVPSSTPAGTGGGDLPSTTVGQGQQDFLNTLQPLAQQVASKTGIDANAMLGIAANETGWGRSSNAQQQNNLFSVQGDGSNGSRWASYQSPADSFQAFSDLIQNSPRYAQAWASRADPSKFVDELRNAGYVADEPGFPAQGWVDQVKGIVNNLPQQAQSVVQQGVQAVNTTVQAAQAAFARAQPVEPQRQFEQEAGLSAGDAYTACGPVAAAAFAKTYGRNPTPSEAIALAQQVGWNPSTGMAGVGSEVKLLNAMGVDAHATAGVDWASVGRDASGGNPVIIDTPGHYYYVDGYNQDTGQLHVGASGLALKGGSEWMTPDQINAMPQSGGAARAAIFADHPLAQQDGLAQSTNRQSLTMGTMQPGSDSGSPDIPSLIGQGVANTPLPFLGGQSASDIGALLGRNQEQLQQGRDLVSSLLQPPDTGQSGLAKQANTIVQAVQDVGSKATQAGQDLLQQGQQVLQQAPQTVGDILNQNAMTAQGIPNIGGKALDQFKNNLMGSNPDQDLVNQNYAAAQRAAEQATGAGVSLPSNPLEMLGGASAFGVGTAGEQQTAQRNAAIEQANPLRDLPYGLGPATTLAAQTIGDPTNLLLGAGPTLGRSLVGGLASRLEPGVAGLISGGEQAAAGDVTRMYHGTGSDFAKVDPTAVSGEGNLYGPGYYLTSDPRVAGGIVGEGPSSLQSQLDELRAKVANPATSDRLRFVLQQDLTQLENQVAKSPANVVSEGYAQARGGVFDELYQPRIDELQANLQRAQETLSKPSVQSNPDAVRYMTDAISGIRSKLADLESERPNAGPNVRALDVPQGLKLLDVDAPLKPEDKQAILEALRSSGDPRDAPVADQFEGWTASPGGTAQNAYAALANVSTGFANKVLADAGFDGVTYAGGNRVPMIDATGSRIQHQATVVFPESLDKIRNAISGTPGGLLPGGVGRNILQGTAQGAISGAIGAGYQQSQQPDSTPQDIAGAALAGAGAGAIRGATGRLLSPMATTGAPTSAITMAERARAYHIANSIGSLATVSKVALNSAINPAWSFLTRGAADLAGGVTGLAPGLSREAAFGRAGGSVMGAQTGLAGGAQAFMDGLKAVGGNPNSISSQATGLGDRIFGRITETPASLHSAFQGFGQHALEQMEIGRLYGQQAGQLGLKGQQFSNFVSQGLANPSTDVLAQAQALGKRAVLRGDLGQVGDYFANMAGQGAGSAGTARSMIGNFLFPVFKVGMNALTQGLEKSPLGAAGTAFDVARSFAGAGPYAGGHFEQPLSSAVTPLSERLTNNIGGVALSLWLGKTALDGGITGDGPNDPDQLKVLQGQGWQPNSVRTPFGYVSYKGTPFEVPAELAGNYADIVNGHVPMTTLEQQQPLALTAAERMVGHILTMVASPTGLETLGNIAELIHGLSTGAPEEFQRGGASTVANLASSWLPLSSTMRSVEQATDPLLREAAPGDVLGRMATGIPGLAQGVQPRLDPLGRDIPNPQQGLGALLPARLGAGAESPILAAMAQVGVAPGATPKTIPYGPANEIRLTPQDRAAYEQYRGQVIQQAAANMVDSPQFQQMLPKSQQLALQQVVSAASSAAEKMVLRDIVAGGMQDHSVTPTGVLAPVQGYQPAGLGDQYLTQAAMLRSQAQHAALMQSLLGGRSGLQALQEANAAAAGSI